MEHNKHKGMSEEEAKKEYIELVDKILKKKKGTLKSPPPAVPQLPPLNLEILRSRKSKRVNEAPKKVKEAPKTVKQTPKKEVVKEKRGRNNPPSGTEVKKAFQANVKMNNLQKTTGKPELPPLPVLHTPSAADQDQLLRRDVFRSRAFSSVEGLRNPLVEDEDVEKKYELYEQVRTFYAKHDPEKLKRGIGNIVEWTLSHGEKALNANLKRKYGTNLEEMKKEQSKKEKARRAEAKKKRDSQIRLSQRYLATKDPEIRQKMDKLTRFLLVNDPELVSRGMYLMVKFIEAKGLGALNENLKENYGKTLDSVSDTELNEELKKRYGNDLQMIEKPFFVPEGEEEIAASQSSKDVTKSNLTLTEQLRTMDPASVREKQMKTTQLSLNSSRKMSKKEEPPKTIEAMKKDTTVSFDSAFFRNSMVQSEVFVSDYDEHKMVLKRFVEMYEPYRFNKAFPLMSDYLKRNGIDKLNKKLMNTYDVNLNTFQDIGVDGSEMSDEEFELRVLQFVNKYESSKNIDRAVKALTSYRNKQGLAALNTKLLVRYGATLNSIILDETAPGGKADRDLSMAELHRIEVPEEIKEKLRSYYAKYDPMVLGNNGIEKIFEWVERNGRKALDKQLKSKYKESLTEFIETENSLKEELTGFYERVDPTKATEKQVSTVLAWAVLNGRDALNFNLRRKYNADLDSLDSKAKTLNRSLKTSGLDI